MSVLEGIHSKSEAWGAGINGRWRCCCCCFWGGGGSGGGIFLVGGRAGGLFFVSFFLCGGGGVLSFIFKSYELLRRCVWNIMLNMKESVCVHNYVYLYKCSVFFLYDVLKYCSIKNLFLFCTVELFILSLSNHYGGISTCKELFCLLPDWLLTFLFVCLLLVWTVSSETLPKILRLFSCCCPIISALATDGFVASFV